MKQSTTAITAITKAMNTLNVSLIFYKSPLNSFSTRRRRSRAPHRRRLPDKSTFYTPTNPSLDNDVIYSDNSNPQSLKLVLDVHQISSLASANLHRFLSSTQDAFYDLKTLVSVDENNRVVFSCRKSTLQFTGTVLVSGFLLLTALRFLIKLGLGLTRQWKSRAQNVLVVRRDRSLGGREVVVSVNETSGADVKRESLGNPLSYSGQVDGYLGLSLEDGKSYRGRSHHKLPKWWPNLAAKEKERGLVLNAEDYQREANRLVRVITDYRTSGKDVRNEDMIQLRRICRESGVRVRFDTTNTRDSFYRSAIDYTLSVCSSAVGGLFAEFDDEDPHHFIAGLAENVGLENTRAARMVSAAVAARTQSCFLQAWALEVQSKHSEAKLELSKLCLVLQTFPPEEFSPEMEMVARGLRKHLNVEQRELLMDMFTAICSEECHSSAAEALGLTLTPKGGGGGSGSGGGDR